MFETKMNFIVPYMQISNRVKIFSLSPKNFVSEHFKKVSRRKKKKSSNQINLA